MTDVPTYIVRGEDNDWVEPPETNWWVCRDGKNVALGLSKEDADSIAAALNRQLDLEAAASEAVGLDCYDAGLLGDSGGGNVEWWQDYIRAELGRAHDFYEAQVPALLLAGERRGLEKAVAASKNLRDMLTGHATAAIQADAVEVIDSLIVDLAALGRPA